MTVEFFSPSDLVEPVDPSRVRRSKTGRPYVKQPCLKPVVIFGEPAGVEPCDGKVPGKRKGTTKQCPKCKGKGYVEKLYSRCTSFVSVLDDTTQLQKWKQRVTLVGVGVDHGLLEALARTDPDDREMLDAIADEAFEIGEGHAKAQKGTDLHKLTEYVDRGEPLPAELPRFDDDGNLLGYTPVTLQDRADLAAWHRTVREYLDAAIFGTEKFVVNDEYEIGGTYDRLVALNVINSPAFGCPCMRPQILDLKTGRIDYGAGKIAQQLGVYANSRDYDPATGERSDQDVCTHFGIVVHLPQGTGHATVHVVDLEAGWAAVELSSKVREYRRMNQNMIWPIESHAEVTQ